MMALKCVKSTKHSQLSVPNSAGGYEFDINMSENDSSTLFMFVYDSLGPIAEKIIVDITNLNGFTLLQQLEDYYIDVDMSVVNRQVLQ